MLKHTELEPRFVKGVPRELEPGVLYVSMEYATVVHGCCCGCGLEVVTQLSPTHWELNFDGEAISLWPSVGNWNLPCRSHYVVRKNKVLEAEPWSQSRVRAAQHREQEARDRYYGQPRTPTPPAPAALPISKPAPARRRSYSFSWFTDLFK
ncbi:DUF6527 family protein [Variovorax paradoxus]|uniref:DUF6527 family protein n=1 Tax=Variovorax paradoxus TaxID=34073 RepID=UPI003ECF0F7C